MNFLQTKLNEMKKRKEAGNKGFSLVELIIVIAIMAILVGIVGTQVIPYINKSRAEKDRQILSSYATAAVTAYTENAENVAQDTEIKFNVYGTNSGDAKTLADAVKEKTYDSFQDNFKSKDAKDGTGIVIDIKPSTHKVTVTLVKGNAVDSATTSLAAVEADL